MTRTSLETKPLTGHRGTISKEATCTSRCRVCLGPVGQRKKICSPRCRLVKWGAYALLEACRAGKADGLHDVIEELRKS